MILPAKNRFATVLKLAALRLQKLALRAHGSTSSP
jgi:hypothetical protein